MAHSPTQSPTRLPNASLAVKVVPGSSRDQIAGMLGDRLKIKVAAAPEHGKANQAVCQLLAAALNLPPRDISVTVGVTNPEKTLQLRGISQTDLNARVAALLQKPR